MGAMVGEKRADLWVWTAVVEERDGSRWMDFEVGGRDEATFLHLLDRLPDNARALKDMSTNGEWRKTTVGEAAPFVYGKGLPRGKRNESGNVPVYGSNGIIGYHDTPLTDKPTIIVGRKGTIGTVHYSPVPCWPIDTTFYICDDAHDDLRFRYYALKRLGLERMNSDTAVPGLNRNAAHMQELSLPPLPAQRAIAGVLGAFDDKIALNAKMNATLEAMARALFRAWFVDFDPVRAKQAGRWRRGETLPGMPAALYDAFPAELTTTELGDVPAGWEARALGDELTTLVSGSRPRGGAVKSGVPSIGAENVLGLGRYDFSKEKYVPPDFFDRLKRKGADVRNGDVLLYKDGAKIGRKTYFDKGFPHADCAVNEHAFILRLRNAAAQRYLYFWLGQDWMAHKIITLNSNTAQPGINQAGVRGLPILMPPDDALSAFDDIASDMTGRIFANCHESRTLAAMRDTLLPRLLSGEVRVE